MIRKKSGGAGKRKGSAFERKICEALSRMIDPKGKDTIFWRSAMSGGRATVQNRKGLKNQTQAGDITCIHDKGMWLTEAFVLECKFYTSLDIETGILNGKGKLIQFWRELYKIAKKHNKAPLLIAKQNRTDILCLTNTNGLNKLSTFGHEVVPHIVFYRNRSANAIHVFWFKELCP